MDDLFDSVNFPLVGVIVFLILALLWFLLRKKERHQRVLLLGCSNSGKTALFSNLVYSKSVQTYTSMKENVGYFTNDKCRVEIVDIPGNERISKNLFHEYKNSARGIIFIVDSESVQKEIRDVAECIFNVLIDPIVRANCNDILVVCNKQDMNLAKGPAVVQMLLEKELSVLRNLKSKQLDSTGQENGGKKKIPFLGHKKKDFEFAHLRPVNVNFTESILVGNDDHELNFQDVKYWLNKF